MSTSILCHVLCLDNELSGAVWSALRVLEYSWVTYSYRCFQSITSCSKYNIILGLFIICIIAVTFVTGTDLHFVRCTVMYAHKKLWTQENGQEITVKVTGGEFWITIKTQFSLDSCPFCMHQSQFCWITLGPHVLGISHFCPSLRFQWAEGSCSSVSLSYLCPGHWILWHFQCNTKK